MTDRELVRAYLGGNNKAYATVVTWMREVTRNHVWHEAVTSDDVIGDACVKLLLNLRGEKFKFESSLKTYVQRITRYTIIDLVRARKNLTRYIPGETPDPIAEKNPLSVFEDEEESFLFSRIVSLIGEQCRKLWQMIFHDEMPYQEIAEKLGINVNTVKQRVFRCKEEAIEIRERLV